MYDTVCRMNLNIVVCETTMLNVVWPQFNRAVFTTIRLVKASTVRTCSFELGRHKSFDLHLYLNSKYRMRAEPLANQLYVYTTHSNNKFLNYTYFTMVTTNCQVSRFRTGSCFSIVFMVGCNNISMKSTIR